MIVSERVEFAGLTFTKNGNRGLVIEPGGFNGWHSPTAVKRPNTSRSGGDGAFFTTAYRSGRIVEVSGHALADTPHELEAMADQFSGVGTQYAQLVVHGARGSRWAWAALLDAPEFEPISEHDARTATFGIQLFCPEPWKYGDVRQVTVSPGSAVEVQHRGSALSWPTVTVTGPVTAGWGLRIGDSRLTYRDLIPASQSVVIETRTGSVRHSAYGEVMDIVSGIIPSIKPGGPQRLHFYGEGSGSARVDITDTYL